MHRRLLDALTDICAAEESPRPNWLPTSRTGFTVHHYGFWPNFVWPTMCGSGSSSDVSVKVAGTDRYIEHELVREKRMTRKDLDWWRERISGLSPTAVEVRSP